MRDRAGLVYFIRLGDQGPIKIGTTTQNLRKRLNGMSVPEVRVLGVTVGGRDLERTLHRRFKHLRVEGEWFKPDDELLHLIEDVNDSSILQWEMRHDNLEEGPRRDKYWHSVIRWMKIMGASEEDVDFAVWCWKTGTPDSGMFEYW